MTLGPQFKVVKSKSIPNVDADRLRDSLSQVHQAIHTPEGLHKWDQPRRSLYDWGTKGLAIRAELASRGEPTGIEGCRWCSHH